MGGALLLPARAGNSVGCFNGALPSCGEGGSEVVAGDSSVWDCDLPGGGNIDDE